MVSASDVVLKYICPALGAVIATATFAAPVKSLRHALRRGSLDELNTYPWAFMTGSTLGWVAYSFVEFNLFVFFANAPGFILSFWLNAGALKLQYLEQIKPHILHDVSPSSSTTASTAIDNNTEEESMMTNEENRSQSENQQQNSRQGGGGGPPPFCTHDKIFLLVVIVWVIVLSSIGLSSNMSKNTKKDIVGVAANINLVAFFAAPLSTIVTVVRTKDSSTIHICTMIMNTSNCVFWFAYALAIMDPFIAVPNGLGLFFGLVQVFLYFIFPRKDPGLQRISSEEALDELMLAEDNRSVGSDGSAGTELKRKSSMIEDKSII